MLRGFISAALAFVVVVAIAYVSLKQVEYDIPDAPTATVVDLIDPPCSDAEHIRELVKETITSGQVCAETRDCTIAQFGCPFGCYTAINSKAVDGVNSLLARVEGCPGCRYRCAPLNFVAVCENRLCQLERLMPNIPPSTPPPREVL